MVSEWAMSGGVFPRAERARNVQRVLDVDASAGPLSALPRLFSGRRAEGSGFRVIEQHREQLDGEERAEREIELASCICASGTIARSAQSAINACRDEAGSARDGRPERLLEHPQLRAQAARTLAEQYASVVRRAAQAQARP